MQDRCISPTTRLRSRRMDSTPPPAGLLRRLGAMLYDALLVIALWMVSLFPIVAIADDHVFGAAVQTLLFFELYGFFAFFWLTRKQTLGMLAWRLAIKTQNDQPMTLNQVTLRFAGALVGFGCFGLGYVWLLFDKQNRSWSDLLSSTRVIYQVKRRA